MRGQSEASVEEILESIKKVIARDNRANAVDERRRRESAGVDEQLKNGLDKVAAEMARETSNDDDADEVLDLADMDFAEETTDAEGDSSPLTADTVGASMRENFAALSMLAQPGAQPQIVRSGETSLEGMVRDMLRPMLAEWLDTNLPGMVEKMVQAEIARIAGKRN